MATWLSELPDDDTLSKGLTSVFNANDYAGHELKVINREPNRYATTFPSEIVTCELNECTPLRVLCKYSAYDNNYITYGHKGGVIYEAQVYGRALQMSECSLPTFYGAYTDPTNGRTMLILEYLDNSLAVGKVPTRLLEAARWLGQFHAGFEELMRRDTLASILRYDSDYYLGWARRVSAFADPLLETFPWLKSFCARFEEVVAELLEARLTVIHGEFYSHNILVRDNGIFPIDWESAAVAAGEVDLAALTERWGVNTITDCEAEYRSSRWPKGTPAEFERTLAAARMYLHLRWLGQTQYRTMPKSFLWRFDELRSLGEQWGLI